MPPKSSAKPHPETDILLPSFIASIPNSRKLASATTHEVYTGEVDEEGKRCGRGALLWPNGNCYLGEWKNGTMDGDGTFLYAVEGDKYIGAFVEDKKHGDGMYTFANGNYFKGGFVGDKRHGEGKYVWTCGDSYEGGWRDGHMEGKGTTLYSNGNRYDGDFVHDRREGYGKLTCADGLSYEGDWLKNMRHGNGILSFPNGDQYNGEWQNDKKHGYGVDTFANGNKYEGQYKQNLKDGEGTMTYANGDSYTGNWQKDKMHGLLGKYYFSASGHYYQGEWKENVRDGQGLYLYPDGSLYNGEWTNDKRNGKGYFIAKNSSNDELHQAPYPQSQDLVYDGQWFKGKMNGRANVFASVEKSQQDSTPNTYSSVPIPVLAQNDERNSYIQALISQRAMFTKKVFEGDWSEGEIKKGTYILSGPSSTGGVTYSGSFSIDAEQSDAVLTKGGDQMVPPLSDEQFAAAVIMKQIHDIPDLVFGVDGRSLGLENIIPTADLTANSSHSKTTSSLSKPNGGTTSRSNSASVNKRLNTIPSAAKSSSEQSKRKSSTTNALSSSTRSSTPPPPTAKDSVKFDSVLADAAKYSIGAKVISDVQKFLQMIDQQRQGISQDLQKKYSTLEAHLDNPETMRKVKEASILWKAEASKSSHDSETATDIQEIIISEKRKELEELSQHRLALNDTLLSHKDLISKLHNLLKLKKDSDQTVIRNDELEALSAKLAAQIETRKETLEVLETKNLEAQQQGSNLGALKDSITNAEKSIDQLKRNNEKLNAEAAKVKKSALQTRANAKKHQTEILLNIASAEKELKGQKEILSESMKKEEARQASTDINEKEVVELEKYQKQLEKQKSDLLSHVKTQTQKEESLLCEIERHNSSGDRILAKRREHESLRQRIDELRLKITDTYAMQENGQKQRDEELLNAQGKLASAEAALAIAVALTQKVATVGRLRKKKSLAGDSSLGDFMSSSGSLTSPFLQYTAEKSTREQQQDEETEQLELEKRVKLLRTRLQEKHQHQHATEVKIKEIEGQLASKKAADKDADDSRRVEGASKEILFNQLTKLRTSVSKLSKEKEKLQARKLQLENELNEDSNDDAFQSIEAANRILATIKPEEWKLIYLRNQLEQRAKTIAELQRDVARIPMLEEQISSLRSEMPNFKP